MRKIENAEICYYKSENLLQDAKQIIETAQNFAYKAVNISMIQRNWLLGKRIAEEELQGKDRAIYGAEIIKNLSVELTQFYGKGFDSSNLYKFVEFYNTFPEIFHAVSGEFSDNNLDPPRQNSSILILDSPRLKSFSLLTWTHYRILFASKYKTYLPTEEELRVEIETQKSLFYLQQKNK